MRFSKRTRTDRGAAALEGGLLLAGLAMAVITGAGLVSGDLQSLLDAALGALPGG